MAVSLSTNIDKIVFTSPNMASPSTAGLRSHVVPSETDLGTWYESGGIMTRAAMAQNIYDLSYNLGIDRPVFGISGIVTLDTTFTAGQTNDIYINTEQVWSLSFPRNLYLDDNSWMVATGMYEYSFASNPPKEDSFLDNLFTSSGTLNSTRNIIINGCATYMEPYNYIFNTTELYKYTPSTKQYTLETTCPYNVNYPVTMIAVNETLYIFYLNTNDLLIENIKYNTITKVWTINNSYEYHSSASTLSEINAVYIDNNIKITLKYSENSIPPNLYIYNYNYISDSWSSTFIATCGKYNLNFNNALIEADTNYLYSLERSSKLLHKIDLNTKYDNQMVIRYETTDKSSSILNGNYFYTYIENSNKFTKIDTTTKITYNLAVPTLSNTDSTIPNESTTLSTDGIYLYLSLNKGISWTNETSLYKYDISKNIWQKRDVPTSGSVNFNGKMCKYGNNIYGSDDTNLYIYNITDNRWTMLSKLPRNDAFDSVIAANATHIYIVISECGYFWRYVLSTGNWEILQSVSLPAPLSYEGTCPGSLLIDDNTIYLGLYYNYVPATKDTFYYKYKINDGTWTAHVTPKTVVNRSFYTHIYNETKSGTNYFSKPKGITSDATYIYISDTYNNRIIKKLKSNLNQVAQIGDQGSGDNNFFYPEGITCDNTYLYITDTFNNRIFKRLASNLNYISKIGEYGSDNDNFNHPKGITSDDTYLYIADTGNNRIVKRLKSNLSYVSKIGNIGSGHYYFPAPCSLTVDDTYEYLLNEGINNLIKIQRSNNIIVSSTGIITPGQGITSDDTYLYIADAIDSRIVKTLKSTLVQVASIGSFGSGRYYFNWPTGVTADNSYIYITDTSNHKLVKIRKSNKVLVTEIGEYGTGNDQFKYPKGITSDDTYLYIVDSTNNRIVKRNKSDLSYCLQKGKLGTGKLLFSNPCGIAHDETYLYITNTNTHTILKINKSDRKLIKSYGGFGVGNYESEYPEDIACDNDYVYVLNTGSSYINKRRKTDLAFIIGSNLSILYKPKGIACTTAGAYLYVANTKNNQILKLTKLNLDYVCEFNAHDAPCGDISNPTKIACDDTYVYFTDTGNNRIIKLAKADMSYVTYRGSAGDGIDSYNAPEGITCEGDYLYVADTGNNRIVKINKSDLSYVSKITTYNSINYNAPKALTKDANYLYAFDTGNNTLVVMSGSNLNYVLHSNYAFIENEFNSPKGITSDNTYLYVVDTGNNRIIKKLKSNLSHVAHIGEEGQGNNQFLSPTNITCDATYLYIADTGNNRIIKRLKSDLSYVSKVGGTEQGDDNNSFNKPYDVSCLYNGTYIYITDTYNNRIVKRLKSDLSYVSESNNYNSIDYSHPIGLVNYGAYIYILDSSNNILVTISKTDSLDYIEHINYAYKIDQFNKPKGITSDNTYLYIADTNNNRIIKRLKSDLSYISEIGSNGAGNDQFSLPSKIICDDTYLYIADTNNNRIVKRLKSDLSYVTQNGTYGSGNDSYDAPEGIVCEVDYVYIADTGNNRIVKRFKSDLGYVTQSKTYNSIKYNKPKELAIYGDFIYILDTNNKTLVTLFKSNFEYVSAVNYTIQENDFNNPTGITSDDTYLYIVDTNNNRIVKRLKSDLSYISEIGSIGTGNNQFSGPTKITCDDTYLYITDTNNNRIVKRLKSNLNYVTQNETYDKNPYNKPNGINTYDGSYIYTLNTEDNGLIILDSNLNYISKLESWVNSENILHIAGEIAYTGNPVDTYTYRDYTCTNKIDNIWSEPKTSIINNMEIGQYICMYGQYYLDNLIYISFTTATNLGFNCSGPKCRQINIVTGISDYWNTAHEDKYYITADSMNTYLYCTSVTTGILWKYDLALKTAITVSIPRQSFTNYFVCSITGNTYLLGKQEIEYNPDQYKYNFYVYIDNSGIWEQYDLQQTTFTSASGLKLNSIEEYYTYDNTVYMAAFIRNTKNTNITEAVHKKYNIITKKFKNLDIPTLTTSITSSGSGNNLFLAVGDEIKIYNVATNATEKFQQGISGNRASAFPYIYKRDGKLYSTGNQYFTPENGGKYITYEETTSGSWLIYDSKNISSTFYNTLDYANNNNELYIVNTTEQMILNLSTLILEYVSSAPYATICTPTISGIILYNDHYACKSYIYNNNTFTEIPSDVIRTHKASNLLFANDTIYFTKNSVTNEISTINVASGTKTIIYNDTMVGDTPFFCNINNDIYILQPKYQTLSTISGNTINILKTELDIDNNTSACSDGNNTIYFTKGENYYLFYKITINSGILTQLPNLPEYNKVYSSIEYYNNKIYYITSNKLYLFDTQNNTWNSSITLQNQIYSKGIKIDQDYIYYCGNTNICKINRLRPETKSMSLSPIPARYYSSCCINGTDIYLQYNTLNLISECTAIIGEEKIITFNLNNVSHQQPSAIPYDFQYISKTEKKVEFSWSISSTANITHYRIYRAKALNEDLTYIGKSTTLSFIDTFADRGITYYYYVKSCNEWGGATSFSNYFTLTVDGYPYKYAITVDSWENRKKEINKLPTSKTYIWGNSNLSFTDTVRINITNGEAYNCYLTAWDDDTHSTTNNILLSNECFRVAAVAFSTKQDTELVEPDIRAMMCAPAFNVILKGNDSYYGKFNIYYEALTDRYGGYIIFKPILINIPEEQLIKGVYLFKTVFHYQYT